MVPLRFLDVGHHLFAVSKVGLDPGNVGFERVKEAKILDTEVRVLIRLCDNRKLSATTTSGEFKVCVDVRYSM